MDCVQELAERLIEKKMTICSCESFTAGLFAASLGGVPGVSAILKGGLVTYFTQMKEQLAHVPPELIETAGVVSAPCARAMAENTRRIMDCDLCVSFTGNAGPGVMEDKPAGRIYCALAHENGCEVYEWTLELPRNQLRQEAVERIAKKVLDYLEKTNV